MESWKVRQIGQGQDDGEGAAIREGIMDECMLKKQGMYLEVRIVCTSTV